jgi:glycosyltransferase involved in cell wall biosynthesis
MCGMGQGIVVLAPYLTRTQAGAAQATMRIANAFAARSADPVTVFTWQCERDLLHPELRIITGAAGEDPRFFWRFPSAYAVRAVRRSLRDAAVPEGALAYTQNTVLGLAYRSLYPSVPVISHTGAVLADREYREEQHYGLLQTAIESRLLRRLERLSYKEQRWRHIVSTKLVADQREASFRLPKGFFEIRPFGIDFKKFDRAAQYDDPRPRFGIPEGAVVLVVVARLVTWKNIDMILRAMAKASAKLALFVVGDGPERSALEQVAAAEGVRDRVHFTGHQPPAPFLAASDLFVLPSRIESFGLAYAEAMAMGLPCIGLRYDPPRVLSSAMDVIPEGVAGFCASNEEDLRDRIEQLAQDAPLRKALGEQAYRHATTRYTIDQYMRCVHSIAEREGWSGVNLEPSPHGDGGE